MIARTTSSYAPTDITLPGVCRPVTAAFRALIALAAATGVVIDLAIGSPLRVLSYFTIQSNVLVAVVFALGARRAWQGRRALPPVVTGGTLLYISITGLVYHFVLANGSSGFAMTDDTGSLSGWHSLANHLLHTVTPLAALLDWLLLTPPLLALSATSRGGLRWRHAALWLLYPLAYLGFALIRGALMAPGSPARYPYPFLDVDAHGYAGVLTNAAVLGLAFYALAVLLVALDRLRPAPRRRRPGTPARENRISSPAAGPLK
ncbi:Pr6Pr family membrane protein [Streptomyces sp. NPDC051214]|uniref:Pr6Pr family membrane protein n=1 Tax=Streptomyces sp. NPDC051214 TaxID=3155282 RepID=UPI003446C2A9